jgi:DNA-binding Lrp family transcriptional regulator
VDRIDRQIVALLRKNARLSNKELAAGVGLAASTTLQRVRRLEGRGVLRGYHADVDLGAVGLSLQAMIAVQLEDHSRKAVEQFDAHVRRLGETLYAFHVAGRYDFLLHVAVRDTEHLRNLVLDHLSRRKEVGHVETSLIFGAFAGTTAIEEEA